MDSSNSGSFQSSSGGAGGGDNEEYDSRTHSISSFLKPANHFNPNLNHLLRPPPPSSHHHPPPTDATFFDPSSAPSFSHSSNPNPNANPLHDLDSVWTRNIRPNTNLEDVRSTQSQTFDTYPTYPNSSRMDLNTKTGCGSDHHQVGVTIKNPKKRTRASRRAPTTVLTTDTTNFRQMVQEFTGIPTAPFTAASSSPFSRRLDLFGRGGDGGTGLMYPLRPSAQKIQPPQPSFLNSTANIIESGTSNNITTATASSNYQLPPSDIHEFQKQPSTLLDLQNPMLSFQSLLQATLPQHSNHLSGFSSASKRWKDQDEKLESFEGVIGNNQNIGGSKLNSGLENVVVSSRNGGDQVQGIHFQETILTNNDARLDETYHR